MSIDPDQIERGAARVNGVIDHLTARARRSAEYDAAVRAAAADCPPLAPRQLVTLRAIFSTIVATEVAVSRSGKDSRKSDTE